MACVHRFVAYKMDDNTQKVVVDKVGSLDATFNDPAMPVYDYHCAVYLNPLVARSGEHEEQDVAR